MGIKAFEDFVLSQKVTSAESYDDNYFFDHWRDGDESYALETRREIEGRNPSLIKEILNPDKVLDVGCGPGVLMHLLDEIGVRCWGVDASPSSLRLATDRVRDRIIVGQATALEFNDDSFDAVVSREVLEHLTVCEIMAAVREMCRVSSRYIYLTTRFHPESDDPFDVCTEFHVDPTHITCLSKDLLRCLFVMHGFKSRGDLEIQLDWLRKGRVMVFEKVAM